MADCETCARLGKDCGGHWHRFPRQATTNPDHRRGRMSLDNYDGEVNYNGVYTYEEQENEDG